MSLTTFTRIFQKFFTREIPLFMMECWWQGEYEEFKKILEGATHFNPLYISKEGKVSVYYDMNNPDTALLPLFDYYRNDPDNFFKESEKFRKTHEELRSVLEDPKPDSIQLLYNGMLSLWRFLPMVIQFSAYDEIEGISKEIQEEARVLRDLSQETEYEVFEAIHSLAENLYPDLKDYIHFLSIKEITQNSIPSKEELEQRKNAFIFFEGNLMYLDTEKFKREFNLSLEEGLGTIGNSVETEVFENVLKGIPASKGTAQGRVRIILSKKDIYKLEEGEILVTHMTTPDFMEGIIKAGAIVTDEGGIMSHAGIICRELNKPCIVGTKIATEFLKDGDLVEVNTKEGLVKKI